MGLEQTLDDTLRQAIKAQDRRTADVVRMLKTRLVERRTAKGFGGAVDDALVADVIGAYRKQLQKALTEFEKLGERGAGQVDQLSAPALPPHLDVPVRQGGREDHPVVPSHEGGAGGLWLHDRGRPPRDEGQEGGRPER